jgi:hypothetical protein
MLPSCAALSDDKVPLRAPIGVRLAEVITTFFISSSFQINENLQRKIKEIIVNNQKVRCKIAYEILEDSFI